MLFKKLFGPKCLKPCYTSFFKTRQNTKDNCVEVVAAAVKEANQSNPTPTCTLAQGFKADMVDTGDVDCFSS